MATVMWKSSTWNLWNPPTSKPYTSKSKTLTTNTYFFLLTQSRRNIHQLHYVAIYVTLKDSEINYIFFVFCTLEEKGDCSQKCLSVIFFSPWGISRCNYYSVLSSLWLTDKILESTFQCCKVPAFALCAYIPHKKVHSSVCRIYKAVFSSNSIPCLRYTLPSSYFPKSSTCCYLTISRKR